MILVTGGAGFIGSHTCVVLAKAGYSTVIIDNLSNSRPSVIDRLERICGTRPDFVRNDIRDAAFLDRIFAEYHITAVIHFAGLQAVGESVEKPLKYYDNVRGTLELLAVMRQANVKTLVFSSSATVYGDAASVPIREDFPRSPNTPYGRSKLIIEEILEDLQRAEPDWRIARLRSASLQPRRHARKRPHGRRPAGNSQQPDALPSPSCHRPPGKTECLWRRLPDARRYRRARLYPCNGSGRRPCRAMDYLKQAGGLLTVNLGTGKGTTVLEMIRAFPYASGCSIPYQIVGRRSGDIAECYVDFIKANMILGWQAKQGIDTMCADAWRWQQANTTGVE